MEEQQRLLAVFAALYERITQEKSAAHTSSDVNHAGVIHEIYTEMEEMKQELINAMSLVDYDGHECAECGELVKQKCDQMAHVRTHTKETPFKCDGCEFECSHQSDLISHKRTHTEERPFKFDECDYQCVTKGDLKKRENGETRSQLMSKEVERCSQHLRWVYPSMHDDLTPEIEVESGSDDSSDTGSSDESTDVTSADGSSASPDQSKPTCKESESKHDASMAGETETSGATITTSTTIAEPGATVAPRRSKHDKVKVGLLYRNIQWRVSKQKNYNSGEYDLYISRDGLEVKTKRGEITHCSLWSEFSYAKIESRSRVRVKCRSNNLLLKVVNDADADVLCRAIKDASLAFASASVSPSSQHPSIPSYKHSASSAASVPFAQHR